MTNRQKELCACVEKNRELIRAAEQYIWVHPETGYKEWETSDYMKHAFIDMGYTIVSPSDIPGFFADIDTNLPGPKVLVICELDALICDNHSDAVDGVVHACGHNAQCAAMLGLAAALKEPSVLNGLSGSIRLMAVPAEELIEVEYRERLRQQGIIHYFGGKMEFIRRGYMDDVDLAFMLHTASDTSCDFSCNIGGNGFIVKSIVFKGVASHAGSAPDKGINALYAANLGIQAINSLRETFADEDHVRVHAILTDCGTSVNIIPDEVKMESYIRAASKQVISDVNNRVNRALAASAAAIGTTVSISDRAGYAPLRNNPLLMKVAKSCMEELVGCERVNFRDFWSRGSTDMGDVSCIMPAIHAYVSGSTGIPHSSSFIISNSDMACVNSAKAKLLMIDKLLKNDAQIAKEIKELYEPTYNSISEYIEELERLNIDRRSVITGMDSDMLKIQLLQLD
jgi:amidohydrolase